MPAQPAPEPEGLSAAGAPAGHAACGSAPSFTLGSADFEGGLRVLHSCTVRLVAVEQDGSGQSGSAAEAEGLGSGPGSPLSPASPGSGGGFRGLVGRAAEAVKAPLRPLRPSALTLGKTYLLYLAADSLQLFRPAEGNGGLGEEGEEPGGSSAGASPHSGGGPGAGVGTLAAAPLRSARKLASKLTGAAAGSESSGQGGGRVTVQHAATQPPASAAAGPGQRTSPVTVEAVGPSRPAMVAQHVGSGGEAGSEAGGSSEDEGSTAGGEEGVFTLGIALAQVGTFPAAAWLCAHFAGT